MGRMRRAVFACVGAVACSAPTESIEPHAPMPGDGDVTRDVLTISCSAPCSVESELVDCGAVDFGVLAECDVSCVIRIRLSNSSARPMTVAHIEGVFSTDSGEEIGMAQVGLGLRNLAGQAIRLDDQPLHVPSGDDSGPGVAELVLVYEGGLIGHWRSTGRRHGLRFLDRERHELARLGASGASTRGRGQVAIHPAGSIELDMRSRRSVELVISAIGGAAAVTTIEIVGPDGLVGSSVDDFHVVGCGTRCAPDFVLCPSRPLHIAVIYENNDSSSSDLADLVLRTTDAEQPEHRVVLIGEDRLW